jgi:major membrane immunogen (membrane-anchored lipoprotein)
MKKNYLYMAALALLTAACSNEDEFIQEGNQPTPGVNMITETITATNGDANGTTRAEVAADAAFTWSAGDQVAVHVSDGKYYTATLTSGARVMNKN